MEPRVPKVRRPVLGALQGLQSFASILGPPIQNRNYHTRRRSSVGILITAVKLTQSELSPPKQYDRFHVLFLNKLTR